MGTIIPTSGIYFDLSGKLGWKLGPEWRAEHEQADTQKEKHTRQAEGPTENVPDLAAAQQMNSVAGPDRMGGEKVRAELERTLKL